MKPDTKVSQQNNEPSSSCYAQAEQPENRLSTFCCAAGAARLFISTSGRKIEYDALTRIYGHIFDHCCGLCHCTGYCLMYYGISNLAFPCCC